LTAFKIRPGGSGSRGKEGYREEMQDKEKNWNRGQEEEGAGEGTGE